jgi:hypothetical protein
MTYFGMSSVERSGSAITALLYLIGIKCNTENVTVVMTLRAGDNLLARVLYPCLSH